MSNPPPKPQPATLRGPDKPSVLLGLVASERDALLQAGPAIRIFHTLGIGIRIFVMPASGSGKLAQWCTELQQSGGIALWVLITNSFEILHRAAALDLPLPLFCQALGPNSETVQKTLLMRITEISAALLPAGRVREAAMTFATMASLRDYTIGIRLQAMRSSATTAAEKNSEFISTRIEDAPGLTGRTAEPETEESRPAPKIAPEDEALLEQSAEGMKKPRISPKTQPQKKSGGKGFEYSLPLRGILNGAKEIAAAYRNPQVTPEHLLAAIIDAPESAAHQALLQMGANLESLAGNLMPHFPPPHDAEISGMFSMADSTWAVLENARSIARERQRPCLTTLDFLEAIALRTSTGATSALWDTGLLAARIGEAISATDASAEYDSVKAAPEEEQVRLNPEEVREAQAKLEKKASAEDQPAGPPGFAPEPKARPDILKCDPDNPELEVVEAVADALLEGRLVAFPIDVMFALVADATNAAAVQRLREAIRSESGKQLGALIHSTSQLKHLARNVSPEVYKLLDELWPGPLTVVFDRHPQRFAHLGSEPTLGLRIPNDYLSLAILSTAGRPLAATSIAMQEGETAQTIAEKFAGVVDVVVDIGRAPADVITTVLSVAGENHQMLREGATSAESLKAHLPKL
jgi:tRNA threonylcarbamoyl adenosine modification protein (Sua5/YciO/YrdC/YwlC family)